MSTEKRPPITIERRQEIFAKDYLTVVDMQDILGLDYNTAATLKNWHDTKFKDYEKNARRYLKRLWELENAIESGTLKFLIEEIEQRESLAKALGFSPDCNPYYIAVECKKMAEFWEKSFKEEV